LGRPYLAHAQALGARRQRLPKLNAECFHVTSRDEAAGKRSVFFVLFDTHHVGLSG
jgi:hypothetical protein